MKKKILISTGGSGGHVIPATILYEHLYEKNITPKLKNNYINISRRLTLLRWTIKISDFAFLINGFLMPISDVFMVKFSSVVMLLW